MPPEYYHPEEPVAKHGQVLPHWQQGEVYVFVTWRLADAIPQSKLRKLAEHRRIWLDLHPQPWAEEVEGEYHRRFSNEVDRWLDAGSGSCILRNSEMNQLVAGALHHFDGSRYELDSYAVMPNHVHVIFRPLYPHKLAAILHSWKRHTARQINHILGRSGELWQERYWDRLLRHPLHHLLCRQYVRDNPVKSGLRKGEYSVWERSFPYSDSDSENVK
ncbi:transposase [Verrucomicrobium sp. BvORR106]|uniref:transposase n=1 Tax=Verrucomicrobium sp. BvORR106 TaxID=1403819 RepID=UPI0009E05472|nr:transposase [Verrucomicrobium sp. BvORR106]